MTLQAGVPVPMGKNLPDGFSMRPMAAADVHPVLAMEQANGTAPHWSEAQYAACLEDSGDSVPRRVALVAEVGRHVVGFGVVRILATPEGGEAELESIVVAMEWRARGIGSALLGALLKSSMAQGARRLDLEVRRSNGPAIALYRRSGMKETGFRRGYYQDPDEDAVLMSLGL
jgi:ribosomal-protein-alanine N-acetyltransferase